MISSLQDCYNISAQVAEIHQHDMKQLSLYYGIHSEQTAYTMSSEIYQVEDEPQKGLFIFYNYSQNLDILSVSLRRKSKTVFAAFRDFTQVDDHAFIESLVLAINTNITNATED